MELEQEEVDDVKKFLLTLAEALSLSSAVRWLFGNCSERNKVPKIEEPEVEDAGSLDEFELVSDEENF